MRGKFMKMFALYALVFGWVLGERTHIRLILLPMDRRIGVPSRCGWRAMMIGWHIYEKCRDGNWSYIERRPNVGGSTFNVPPTSPENARRLSAMSSGKSSTVGTLPSSLNDKTQQASSLSFPTGPTHITASSITMRRTLSRVNIVNANTDIEEVVW